MSYDGDWVKSVTQRGQIKTQSLEAQLSSNKSELSKGGIRNSLLQLGTHYYNIGQYGQSLKSLVRARDYCSTPTEMAELCLQVIKVSIALDNFSNVSTYLNKVEGTKEMDKDNLLAWKLKACSGLVYLHQGDYSQAANTFLKCKIDISNNFADVILPCDIALYGTLCTLSSLSRHSIRSQLLNNISFNEFLNNNPLLKELAVDMCTSKYAQVFKILDELTPLLKADYYLKNHYIKLISDIRSKAISQYFSTFLFLSI